MNMVVSLYEVYLTLGEGLGNLSKYMTVCGKENKNSRETLEVLVLERTVNQMTTGIVLLQLSQKLCIRCLYKLISDGRKIIHRYLSIEHDMPDDLREILEMVLKDLNECCVYIKKYDVDWVSSQHIQIENDAYEIIHQK